MLTNGAFQPSQASALCNMCSVKPVPSQRPPTVECAAFRPKKVLFCVALANLESVARCMKWVTVWLQDSAGKVTAEPELHPGLKALESELFWNEVFAEFMSVVSLAPGVLLLLIVR